MDEAQTVEDDAAVSGLLRGRRGDQVAAQAAAGYPACRVVSRVKTGGFRTNCW